jgi:hypothetical protein
MYHIRGESILTFLEDRTTRLPRFQRKQTWNNDQNFKLAISVFKDFPIGVTIINKQTLNGKSTRWLLDGRQRRNALEKMYQDPENIYVWAKKYLGIKSSDQPLDIQNKFWEKIEAYLNDADESGFNDARNQAIEKGENEFYYDGKVYSVNSKIEVIEDYEGDFSDEDLDSEFVTKSDDELVSEYNRSVKGNLDELLFIIQTVHNKTVQKSGFTAPFDLRKIIPNLSYSINGNQTLSGQLLKTFISEFLKYIEDNHLQEANTKSLVLFYRSRHQLNEKDFSKVSSVINQNWADIEKSIEVERILKSRLQEAIIGIIETIGITATDSQMIFTLINKEGTKLSAVEILSAKPSWNIIVKSPSNEVENERKLLYEAIKNDAIVDTVRWDYPATIYARLSNFDFLFPKLDYQISNQLDKKLTLGFKILSGIYQKGIKKEDVDALSLNRDINWESDIDKLISDLQVMGRVLSESDYFKYLKGLGKSYLEITSDAIALNFLFTCYYDFVKKGMPIGQSSKTKIFIHNAIILADKLMFEYITFKWRGSSDGKIAKNISFFGSLPEKFVMVDEKSWINLFKSINDKYEIDDSEITFGLSKSLIYHIYSMMSYSCPSVSSFDIDHIIPQTLFESSNIAKANLIKNALFNLCPLPTKENIKKNDKKLKDISDKWLINQIVYFSNIMEVDFIKFSNIQNWEELKKVRREFFEKQYILERNKILNN